MAATAGGALGAVSLLAIYMMLKPDASTGVRPSGESPFAHAREAAGEPARLAAPSTPLPERSHITESAPLVAAPPPAPAPQQSPHPILEAPELTEEAPTPAPSAPEPRAEAPRPVKPPPAPKPRLKPRQALQKPSLPPPQPAPAPKRKPATEKKPRPQGPQWTFEGVAFDLLTARGVFAARLVFVDADGDEVGETETGPAGRYRVSLPAGSSSGYALKIVHGDYTGRYIDENDSTSSLREATEEERRILIQASARNLPWVGNPKAPVHRDVALVPRTSEEP